MNIISKHDLLKDIQLFDFSITILLFLPTEIDNSSPFSQPNSSKSSEGILILFL